MSKNLHIKGWSQSEISNAEAIKVKATQTKNKQLKMVEDSMLWFTIATGLVGNLILSVVLIPIYIAGNDYFAYILTSFFGFLLGTLVFGITKQMQWLARHHHMFLALLIPLMGIFNFFIVVTNVNKFNLSIGIKNLHDPWLIGVVYFVSFAIPYGFLLWTRRV